ncbi:hypothetical protein Lser_V15G41254 [Lactuca serriola]
MANRPKENSPLGPDPVDDQDEEEENPHVSPRESTPPRSPTPPESPKQVLIPTLPPSPKTTKVPTPPPSPKQKALLSAPTDILPILIETTSLPTSTLITSIFVSTIPLSTPLITESITTTIPNITVEVNVSDTGATYVIDTPVINIPPSSTPSSASGATLGGDDEDFDSLYYSPYRIPIENDADAPVTSQHIQDIHDKLHRLLVDSKAYGSVVLKAFWETPIKQYTDAATKEVSEVVHTTQIFLDSLKSHADTNQAKYESSVDSFSQTLRDETTKFEALRNELKTESTSFLQSVDSLFVTLAAESTLKEDLIKHQATIDIHKIQLMKGQAQIESDSDTKETIVEALQRKKRDRELDETMKVAREAEEKERRNKEEEDALQCKKTMFPEWDRDTLMTQAIEFPSVYWLEPVASFDYDNSRDLQFDMPITRKAFTFHFFDVTAEVPHPNLKFDRELINFYLKNGQPQYLTWSAQKITKVKVLKTSPSGRFLNVNFKINRGSANTEHFISLADLPNLNLHDWILLYNILLSNFKEYEPIHKHLKRMLASYVHELATMDQEIAKVMNKKPSVKPTSKHGDVNKMKLGQIDSTNLTVMFTKGERHMFMFALVDKHLFSTDCLEHIINIIHRCNQNSVAEKKYFIDMLRWYITFRHHVLAIIPRIFETVKKFSVVKRD